MTYVTFTAVKNLQAGRTYGDSVTLDLSPLLNKRLPRPVRKGSTRTALGGRTVRRHHRVEDFVDCATRPLSDAELADMEEFLGSVDQEQEFIFDKLGTPASPDNPLTAKILRDPNWSQANLNPQYTVSFNVRTF